MRDKVSISFAFLLLFLYVFRFHLFGNDEQLYIVVFVSLLSLIAFSIFVSDLKQKSLFFTPYNYGFLVFLTFMTLSLFYSKYTFMLFSGVSLILVYVVILIMVEYITEQNLFWRMYRSYSFGVLVTCLLVSVIHNLVSIKLIENRFGWFEYKGEVISDPNYFAVFIGLSLFYFCFTHKERRTLPNIMILSILSYFFLGTLSRGVVLAFLITSLITYLLKEENKQRILFYLLFIMLCIPVISIVYSKFGSEQASNINYQSFNRFFLRDSSERVDVWRAIYNGFANSDVYTLFFGNGFQSGSSIGAKYYLGIEPTLTQLTFKNPHNMFLQFLIELGIVGIIMLSILFIFFFLKSISHIKNGNYVPISLLLFFIIVNLSLNVMGFRELFFIYGVLLLGSIRISKGLNTEGKEVVIT